MSILLHFLQHQGSEWLYGLKIGQKTSSNESSRGSFDFSDYFDFAEKGTRHADLRVFAYQYHIG